MAAALAVAAALAGGCAVLPTSGTPASAPARPAFGGGGGGGCCALIVRGPQAGWSAEQVVSGFLVASAKPAHDFALAREYLAPGRTRDSWQPGSAVTILSQTPKVSRESERLTQPGGSTTVVVSGQEMATLAGDQYTPAGSGDQPTPPLYFTMKSVNGHTMIGQLPANGLLLTDNLFHLVYTARVVYYYGLRNSELVPSPVFVPADSDIARTLVNDLRQIPPGGLRDAVGTGFQPGSRVDSVQTAPGRTAIVSIHLPRGTSYSTYLNVASQVVATLTGPGYGTAPFEAVKLKVNGKQWSPRHSGPVLTQDTAGLDRPRPGGNGPVYYLTPAGSVRMLSLLSARGIPAPGEAGTSRLALHTVAVSPDHEHLAGIAGPADTVYTGDLTATGQSGAHPAATDLRSRLIGTDFSSLSWDNEDELWVAGRVGHKPGVWVLPKDKGGAMRVSLPRGLGGHVTGVRIAPDGMRIAMIVGWGPKAHLELGYITGGVQGFSVTHVVSLGPGLSGVSAMSWFDENHLVAAARYSPPGPQPRTSPLQLWEVPVNGDSATSLHWQQSGVTAITAAGPHYPLYLSRDGRLEKSVGLGEPWTDVTAGQAVDYPG